MLMTCTRGIIASVIGLIVRVWLMRTTTDATWALGSMFICL